MSYDPANPLGVATPIPYAQQREQILAAQAGMSREELKQKLISESEHAEDMEALVEAGRSRTHNWVDRGLKMSCEGANHPHHVVWKRMARK